MASCGADGVRLITRNGNENIYTRAGSFSFDGNGLLVTATGEAVQGWTAQDGLHEVGKALEAALGEAESVKLAWRPQTPVAVDGDDAAQLLKLIDALEDDDDVQTVWGNYEVSDEVLEKLG